MQKLKKYLVVNAAFSGISGLTMLLLSQPMQRFFGFQNDAVFPAIGINLVLFAILVFSIANKQLKNKTLVNLISVMDFLWVIGSIVIIAKGMFDLSTNGYLVIGVVAVWIAYLGVNQVRLNR
ncbi:MAG: hypothetical protein JJ975_04490 [Bacteroidia bacterium]|nr:hypothetical protein [Bacteroidia bacterium]